MEKHTICKSFSLTWLSKEITFPSLVLVILNTTYNQQKTKTDFRQEDALNEGALCRCYLNVFGHNHYAWMCRGLHLPGGQSSKTLQLSAEP